MVFVRRIVNFCRDPITVQKSLYSCKKLGLFPRELVTECKMRGHLPAGHQRSCGSKTWFSPTLLKPAVSPCDTTIQPHRHNVQPEAFYLLTRSWERLLISCPSKTLDAKTVTLHQRRRWHEDPVRLSFKGTGVECDCQPLLSSKCNIVTPDYDNY